MSTLVQYLVIALGGALGAAARYGMQHLGIFEQDKYYYTVGINVGGCLVIGILWALFHYWGWPRWTELFFIGGILGGFTTYSAFTLDALQLFQVGRWGEGFFYIGITMVGGLGACALGLFGTYKILGEVHP